MCWRLAKCFLWYSSRTKLASVSTLGVSGLDVSGLDVSGLDVSGSALCSLSRWSWSNSPISSGKMVYLNAATMSAWCCSLSCCRRFRSFWYDSIAFVYSGESISALSKMFWSLLMFSTVFWISRRVCSVFRRTSAFCSRRLSSFPDRSLPISPSLGSLSVSISVELVTESVLVSWGFSLILLSRTFLRFWVVSAALSASW